MPSTVLKFRSNGDEQTAQLLEEVIYKVTDLVQEQCGHVICQEVSVHYSAMPTNLVESVLCFGQEEVTHCAAGVRWLTYLHDLAKSSGSKVSERQATTDWIVEARKQNSVETWFHELVRTHFRGSLKVRSQSNARCCACVVQVPTLCLWYTFLSLPQHDS